MKLLLLLAILLCQSDSVAQVRLGMTPREAIDSLESKGYTASSVIDEHGKTIIRCDSVWKYGHRWQLFAYAKTADIYEVSMFNEQPDSSKSNMDRVALFFLSEMANDLGTTYIKENVPNVWHWKAPDTVTILAVDSGVVSIDLVRPKE